MAKAKTEKMKKLSDAEKATLVSYLRNQTGLSVVKTNEVERLREAVQLLLDCVDYTSGACTINEIVGACLPREVIDRVQILIGKNQTKQEESYG